MMSRSDCFILNVYGADDLRRFVESKIFLDPNNFIISFSCFC